jgi:hypothetical protein
MTRRGHRVRGRDWPGDRVHPRQAALRGNDVLLEAREAFPGPMVQLAGDAPGSMSSSTSSHYTLALVCLWPRWEQHSTDQRNVDPGQCQRRPELGELRPYLAGRARSVDGTVIGHTIITRARPETTDEQEPPTTRHGLGDRRPWLASRAVRVDGELNGKSVVTSAAPETSDEGDEAQ